jgi:hypothetical protein
MEAVIGVSLRIIRRKDLERLSGLMVENILDNTKLMTSKVMVYTEDKMVQYTKDNIIKINVKVSGIKRVQMALNISDSLREVLNGEKEY